MRRLLVLPCVLPALALAACASSVSTSSFHGEQHAVAQTIANLQTDATAGEQKKLCAQDMSAAAVARLGAAKGCEQAVKHQLDEVDSLEVSVESVQVAADGKTATASVKSIDEGKQRAGTVSLVKEDGRWKISAVS
jgi:copper chaperone CopZ